MNEQVRETKGAVGIHRNADFLLKKKTSTKNIYKDDKYIVNEKPEQFVRNFR